MVDISRVILGMKTTKKVGGHIKCNIRYNDDKK